MLRASLAAHTRLLASTLAFALTTSACVTGNSSSEHGSSPSRAAPETRAAPIAADACTESKACLGAVCVGTGCDQPWRCDPTPRVCKDDVEPFCGCNGKTFYTSGTCPRHP